MCEDFRQSGIMAWVSSDYEYAFCSLFGSDVTFLFPMFDVMCTESEGDKGKIDRIASKNGQSIYEVGNLGARTIDAYIDTMCNLVLTSGIWLLASNCMDIDMPDPNRKRYHLNHLLGIERLRNFTGWIDRRTTDSVRVHLFLPTAAQNINNGFTAEFPISSCPALQDRSSKETSEHTSCLQPTEDDSQLRPYQSEQKSKIMQAWETCRRVMFQMPTDTGKTCLFVSLIRDILKQQLDARILIVAHRTELIDQISHSLTAHYELRHGILGTKGTAENFGILVASIQRLSHRIGKEAPQATFDYIIIDEAHHSLAPTYKKPLEAYPDAKALGVTATPYRLKKASFTGLYDTLVESQPMRQFIVEGYLTDYRLFTVSDRTVAMGKINRLSKFGTDGNYKAQDLNDILDTEGETERLYECYAMYAAGKKGIVYAVSRSHAAHIAKVFNDKGAKAASINCDTPREERQRLIEEFKGGVGGLQVLVNVELFTEGFDCPDIEFVMLARPTRSLTLYLQQVGRALRPTPNGSEVVILDCAGLYNRFGLPERNRDWQSHFKGLTLKQEDYTKRPVGLSSVNGLMKEVERMRKIMVHADGNVCIYTIDNARYGLCDKSGRTIFPPLYEKITSTADGWHIGYRKTNGTPCQEVLSHKEAKAYPFRNIIQDPDGTYSAERIESTDNHVLAIRFDKSLRLIPSKTIKVGTKSCIYQHGDGQSHETFYTTVLVLDALIYSDIIHSSGEVTRLKGFNCRMRS